MTYHLIMGSDFRVWLAESDGDMPVGIGPVEEIIEQASAVQRVIDLWNRMNGWIPGGAYEELAEVLGVSTDRLVHPGPGGRYYPPGVEHIRYPEEIKPRDLIVVNGKRAAWISHIEEFYSTIGFDDGTTRRVPKAQPVSIMRGV